MRPEAPRPAWDDRTNPQGDLNGRALFERDRLRQSSSLERDGPSTGRGLTPREERQAAEAAKAAEDAAKEAARQAAKAARVAELEAEAVQREETVKQWARTAAETIRREAAEVAAAKREQAKWAGLSAADAAREAVEAEARAAIARAEAKAEEAEAQRRLVREMATRAQEQASQRALRQLEAREAHAARKMAEQRRAAVEYAEASARAMRERMIEAATPRGQGGLGVASKAAADGEEAAEEEEDVWERIRRVVNEAASEAHPIPPLAPAPIELEDPDHEVQPTQQPTGSVHGDHGDASGVGAGGATWDRGFLVSGRAAPPPATNPKAVQHSAGKTPSSGWGVSPSGFAISGRVVQAAGSDRAGSAGFEDDAEC